MSDVLLETSRFSPIVKTVGLFSYLFPRQNTGCIINNILTGLVNLREFPLFFVNIWRVKTRHGLGAPELWIKNQTLEGR